MPSPSEETQRVGAVVDPATKQVMAWVSAPGHPAHLVPLSAETARSWAGQIQRAADAADRLHDHDSDPTG